MKKNKYKIHLTVALTFFVSAIVFTSCHDSDFFKKIPASKYIQSLPFRYKDQIIITCKCDQKPCIKSLSIIDGHQKWIINTDLELWSHGLDCMPYINNNIWISVVDSSIFQIDLENGKILSEKKFEGKVDNFILGHGDIIFPKVHIRKKRQSVMYRWDLSTNKFKIWENFEIPYDGIINIKGPVKLNRNLYQHSLLIYAPHKKMQSYFRYLDSTGCVVDEISLKNPKYGSTIGVTQQPILDRLLQRYYWHTVDGIIATDARSGDILWSNNFRKAMMVSQPLVMEGFILYPSDSKEILFINKTTGKIISETDSMPSVPSRFYESNGMLYSTNISGLLNQYTIISDPISLECTSYKYEGKQPVFPSIYADDDIMVIHCGEEWLVGTPNKVLEKFLSVEQ